jgi:hypothetical protein
MLAVVTCVLLPGMSWLDGSGWLAWTMYAKSEHYRMRFEAHSAGHSRWISPTLIAAHAAPDVRNALAGAEVWHHGGQGRMLERRMDAVGELACSVARADNVVLTLERRRTLDAPVQTFRVSKHCRK